MDCGAKEVLAIHTYSKLAYILHSRFCQVQYRLDTVFSNNFLLIRIPESSQSGGSGFELGRLPHSGRRANNLRKLLTIPCRTAGLAVSIDKTVYFIFFILSYKSVPSAFKT